MSHVPTVLKSDRSVFDKMLPVDVNGYIYAQDRGLQRLAVARLGECAGSSEPSLLAYVKSTKFS